MTSLFFEDKGGFARNRNADLIVQLANFKGDTPHTTVFLVREVQRLYSLTDDPKEKIKYLSPVKNFCLKMLELGLPFNEAHIAFLKLVIDTRSYKDAVEVLEHPFIQTGKLESDEILEYLYYAGIIWTVLEQYRSAVECFGFINRIETKPSNLQVDAVKKLNLIKVLLGEPVFEKDQSLDYVEIIRKLESNEPLTPQETKTIAIDGNTKLVEKIKTTLIMKQLREVSLLYNRVSINNLSPIFALPETISQLNKLRHTYRYDPRTQCLIFENKKTDIQKAISKTVKTYFGIIAEEESFKAEKTEKPEFFF